LGKTPIPLVIWVDPRWRDREEIQALAAKGHKIHEMSFTGAAVEAADLILSPVAHWWDDKMWAKPMYLETALKVARARRKKSGRGTTED
jgi:hypothetical protein